MKKSFFSSSFFWPWLGRLCLTADLIISHCMKTSLQSGGTEIYSNAFDASQIYTFAFAFT